MGMTVWEAVERRRCATIQLNSQFVAAGKTGDFIEAYPEIVRLTRSVVFMRGTLTTAGRTILSAEGVWKVLGA
jgi:acyl-coenzyme A thioesterase PaaI-like protein